jgi:lysozyme
VTVWDLIIRHEGVRLRPYVDATGHRTIGVGHNLDVHPLAADFYRADGSISPATCDEILGYDIAAVVGALQSKLAPWYQTLDEVRQAVLIDMGFNLGVAGLLTFAHTLGCVSAGNYESAAASMLASKWATQVGPRATEDAAMMSSGLWPPDGPTP